MRPTERDSFVFHKEWVSAVRSLTATVRAEIYEAIIEYGISGTIPAGLGVQAKIAFGFVKERIDSDREKWEATIRARSDAGKLGGRPKKGEKQKKQMLSEKAKKANAFFEKQKKAKKAVSVTVMYNSSNEELLKGKTNVLPLRSVEPNDEEVEEAEDSLSGFEEFWRAYPARRKVAKHTCREKWRAQKLEAIAPRIVGAVRILANSEDWKKENGQYVPMPATFINQRRWEDVSQEAAENAREAPKELSADERHAIALKNATATKIAQWNALYADLPEDQRPKCPFESNDE